MGRQSSRLYFQGKDHKDIYFNGHYHDAMYLSDGEGNVTLVWEKLKEEQVKYISMITYINGRYYVVAESAKYVWNSKRPLLYEGISLDSLKNKGAIWGDVDVDCEYFIMHTFPEELIVIRTGKANNDTGVSNNYHIARIPLRSNGADMGNIAYAIESGKYMRSNTNGYYFGNGDNYYSGYLMSTGDALINIGSSFHTIDVKSISGGDEIYEKHVIDITELFRFFEKEFAKEQGWNQSELIDCPYSTVEGRTYVVGKRFVYYCRHYRLSHRKDNKYYTYDGYCRMKLDLDTYSAIKYEIVSALEYTELTVYNYSSWHILCCGNDRVQGVMEGILDNRKIAYGTTDGDYMKDTIINISNLPNYRSNNFDNIVSLARKKDTLLVGITVAYESPAGFIEIDTKNKTARYISSSDITHEEE